MGQVPSYNHFGQIFFISGFTNPSTVIFRKEKKYITILNIICFVENIVKSDCPNKFLRKVMK